MPSSQLLDLTRLETALGGDTALIGDILQMYESSAAEDLSALESAVSKGDPSTIARFAHSLKGASANVGADAVASLAARIETAARAGEVGQAVALLPDLDATFSDTLQACRAHRAA